MNERSSSTGRREVHAAKATRLGGGPAAGDRLAAGVEADALGAVDVVVAEDRILPAAEGVEGHRHRDRHVDADHPDLDLALEAARLVAGAGEDRRSVGEGVAV